MHEIEFENISKIYGSHPREVLTKMNESDDWRGVIKGTKNFAAAYNVNLAIEKGEFFVVLGIAGSGKSSLLRMINASVRPTLGNVLVCGDDILKYTREQMLRLRREKVSVVFDGSVLIEYKTVLENIMFGLDFQKLCKSEKILRAKKALSLCSLEEFENSQVGSLPLDIRLKTELARAFCSNGDIILMDESLNGLDPLLRKEMQFELLRLNKSLKKTIVFTTHDANEAFKLADRLAVIQGGEIVQIGTPEQVLTTPSCKYVEDLIQDINRSKVITAKNIMGLPSSLIFNTSGPHWAIKEMKENGVSSAFVVGGDMTLRGLITLDGAVDAINRCVTLSDAIITDIPVTGPDTNTKSLMQMASIAKYPISVVDDDGRLLGIVTRAAVMASIAEI